MKPLDARTSALMARVRQRRTQPEEQVAAVLRRLGVAYRRNVEALPGSPDFANRTRGWAINVHGCFWHRHPGCRRTTTPKHNGEFWRAKFDANVARDRLNELRLRELGLRVATVWECETADPRELDLRLSEFLEPRSVERG